MKLQKVLALTLLAATVGCASTPVAVKNITNNANSSIVKVNKTGSVTVPVTFPALKKFNTQGTSYAGGEVQTVVIRITAVDSNNALDMAGFDRSYVLARNPFSTAGAAGGSSDVTFNNIPAGNVIVTVTASDKPITDLGATGAEDAWNNPGAQKWVLDPATMASVSAVSAAADATSKSWVASKAVLLFAAGNVTLPAAPFATVGHEGFDGKLVAVAAGTNTAASLAVTGREPAIYDHSVPAYNIAAGTAVSLSGANLVTGDLAIIDEDNNDIDDGDYVYSLTASTASAASFTPLKTTTVAGPIFINRGMNNLSNSVRCINVVPGDIDITKTEVVDSAAHTPAIDFGTYDYQFYDANNNLVSNIAAGGALPSGVILTTATTAGSSLILPTPSGSDKGLYNSTTNTFGGAANGNVVGGRKVTFGNTDWIAAGAVFDWDADGDTTGLVAADGAIDLNHDGDFADPGEAENSVAVRLPMFNYTQGIPASTFAANFIADRAALPAGSYTLEALDTDANAAPDYLELRNAAGNAVATWDNSGVAIAPRTTYTLTSTGASTGTKLISFKLAVAPQVAGTATVAIADVRATGYDTDNLTFSFVKDGITKSIAITGAY